MLNSKFVYIFSKYLIYNKYRVNLNSIYLLQNCLLILICKILKYRKILFVRKYRDFENKKIDSTIEKYIAIKIWIEYRLNLNIIYMQNK